MQIKSKGKVKKQSKIKVMEIDMMRIDPGAIGFTSGFSQEYKYSTAGEQITAEQLIEKCIFMKIYKAIIMNVGITSVSSRSKRFYIYYYYSTHRPLSSMHLEY